MAFKRLRKAILEQKQADEKARALQQKAIAALRRVQALEAEEEQRKNEAAKEKQAKNEVADDQAKYEAAKADGERAKRNHTLWNDAESMGLF